MDPPESDFFVSDFFVSDFFVSDDELDELLEDSDEDEVLDESAPDLAAESDWDSPEVVDEPGGVEEAELPPRLSVL